MNKYEIRLVEILVVLLLCTAGCKVKYRAPGINIERKINVGDALAYNSLSLSHIIKNVRAVRLQRDSGYFIKEIDKIVNCENKYFVLDRYQSQGIFVFDDNGKFLYKINTIGSAPGAIAYPLDFIVDTTKHELIVLDSDNERVNYYDERTGSFKYSLNLNISCTRFSKIKSGGWWLAGGNSGSNIMLANKKFERRMGYLPTHSGRPVMIHEPFINVDDTLKLFVLNYADTIYRLKGDYISAYTKIMFNTDSILVPDTAAFKDITKAYPEKKILYKYYFESGTHIFFTYLQNRKYYCVLLYKNGNKIIKFPAANIIDNPLFLNSFPVLSNRGSDCEFLAIADGNVFASVAGDPNSEKYFDIFENKVKLLKELHEEKNKLKNNPIIVKFDFQ